MVAWAARLDIKQRMLLVVLVAILPLLVLLLVGSVADRRIAIGDARAQTTDRARLGAAWQESGFQHATDVLNVLRRTSAQVVADPMQCNVLVRQIAERYPQFTSVGFVGTDGIVRCVSLDAPVAPFRLVEAYKAGMAAPDGALVRSAYLIGSLSHKPLVALVEPLPREGSADAPAPGIAYVTLDLDWATNRAREFAMVDQESFSLIDTRSGTVLAHYPDQQAFSGTPLPGGVLLSAVNDHPAGGSLEAADLDGTDKIFGFAPLEDGLGLMVAVGVPRNVVLAAANQRLLLGVALALLAATVAAGLAWFFADRTQVRAIRLLAETARRLGAGDLSARAAIEAWQAPEFQALGETLSRMASGIALAQTNLRQSEQQLRLLADYSIDMILHTREDGTRLFASPACEKLTGWTPKEMLAHRTQDMLHPDDVGRVADPRLFGEAPYVYTYRMRHKDGHYLWLEGAARGLPTGPGLLRESIVLARDVSERIEAEQRLKDSEARYRLLEEQGTDMVFQLGADLVIGYVSPACFEILGATPPELTGLQPADMVHPDEAERVAEVLRAVCRGAIARTSIVCRVRHRDGHWIWAEVHLKALAVSRAGREPGLIGSLRDVSVRKAAEEKLEAANRRLEALARLDGLTGLANRRAFDERFAMEWPRAGRSHENLALIMIDVDRFKAFNDRYGHLAGDECLRQVSRAIDGVLYRPGDLAARYGGEEFVILLPDTDEPGAARVADRIRQAVLALHVVHEASPLGRVSVSAGVAVHRSGTADLDERELVQEADRALYAAKAGGRNAVACASSLAAAGPTAEPRSAAA